MPPGFLKTCSQPAGIRSARKTAAAGRASSRDSRRRSGCLKKMPDRMQSSAGRRTDPDAGRPAASPPDGERGELVRGKEVKGRKGAKTAGIRATERCYKMRV